jgi:hypothetical protein
VTVGEHLPGPKLSDELQAAAAGAHSVRSFFWTAHALLLCRRASSHRRTARAA